MEILPKDVILQFEPYTLEAVRRIHGIETCENMAETIDKLEKSLQTQNNCMNKTFSRHYLETTLIASKGSLARAQRKLENVRRQRKEQPQFFGNFHVRNDFKNFNEVLSFAILPKQTIDYNRILLIKYTGRHFQPDFILQFARIFIIVFEYLKVKDYSDGIIAIFDLEDVALVDTLRRIKLEELRQAASILIEGYGVRVKGLHVISKSKIINALIWIFKQVLNAKLVDRLHVHRSAKTIHKFVSKDILPLEYGGIEKSLANIHREWQDVLSSEEFRNYLTTLTEQHSCNTRIN